MSFRIVLVAGFLILAASPSVLAKSPVLDASASSIVLDYWKALKAGNGLESKFLADDATLEMTGLGGGPYNREIMSELVSSCELAAMFGGDVKSDRDPTKFIWAIVECLDDGTIETVPLGLGVRDQKITQVQIDMFSKISLDGLQLGRDSHRPFGEHDYIEVSHPFYLMQVEGGGFALFRCPMGPDEGCAIDGLPGPYIAASGADERFVVVSQRPDDQGRGLMQYYYFARVPQETRGWGHNPEIIVGPLNETQFALAKSKLDLPEFTVEP
jgi:hypothetical protein